MKKRVIKIIILSVVIIWIMALLFICVAMIILSNCNNDAVVIRGDKYFQYIIVGENSRYQDENDNSLAIIDFTSLGLEQESLDIPREIDGKTVKHIGFRDEGFSHYNSHRVYCSENLKKIYVHDNIKKIDCFYGSKVDIMICSIDTQKINTIGALFKKMYIYKSLFEKVNSKDIFSPANIVFMNNYSDEVNGGYYRLDNIEAGEKIPVVPNPEREGYSFIGWYTEPECLNVWDFKVSPTIEEDTEFRLYAAWQEL